MTELKPCPFCGNMPQVWFQKGTGRFVLKCSNTIERFWSPCGDMDTYARSEMRAFDRWNRKVESETRRKEKKNKWKAKFDWERIR